MHSELLNLSLFVSAIAKVLLMTGVGMGGVVALLAECCGFRVVALGVDQVSGDGQLAPLSDQLRTSESWATSPSRKVRHA
jgi:hypothetical protein